MYMHRAVRIFNFLRLNGELAHSGCESSKDRVHNAHLAGCCLSGIKLRLLVEGHLIEEPRVRVVLNANFDVDQHASAEERGAMTETFLGISQPCTETC